MKQNCSIVIFNNYIQINIYLEIDKIINHKIMENDT